MEEPKSVKKAIWSLKKTKEIYINIPWVITSGILFLELHGLFSWLFIYYYSEAWMVFIALISFKKNFYSSDIFTTKGFSLFNKSIHL